MRIFCTGTDYLYVSLHTEQKCLHFSVKKCLYTDTKKPEQNDRKSVGRVM